MNTFGTKLKLTTFGESHGYAIGGVLDGLPSGIEIDWGVVEDLIERRRGGRSSFVTQRKEKDEVEILSGVFEDKTTGTPLAFLIKNTDCKSGDYELNKGIFRPSHADFTYFHKYKHYDYRGGGRSSARETLVRVVASAMVESILQTHHIQVQSGIYGIGGIEAKELDFEFAKKSEIYSLDSGVEQSQIALIEEIKQAHNSIGGVAMIKASGELLGLGEPLYNKLDSALAGAMMGINGVKAVEIGEGVNASKMKGSTYNDLMNSQGFMSNHSGGILGGIGNGQDIILKIHFKPTPSIFLPQQTINQDNQDCILKLKGRHDPCIAIRGCVVAEAMMRLVLADMILQK